jgi:hypothetical protein
MRSLAVISPACSPEKEDSRRIGREGKVLVAERILRVNRIKGRDG